MDLPANSCTTTGQHTLWGQRDLVCILALPTFQLGALRRHSVFAGSCSCTCKMGPITSTSQVLEGQVGRYLQGQPGTRQTLPKWLSKFLNDNEKAEPKAAQSGERPETLCTVRSFHLSPCSLGNEKAGGDFQSSNKEMETLTQEKET